MKNQRSKIKKFFYLVAILTLAFCFLSSKPLYATNMNSSSFQIQSASINDAAGSKSSSSYKLSDTIGQLAAGQFSSTGYVIKAGFQYLNTIIPFSFSVSDTRIDFGEIIANSPKTATTNLTVSFGGGGQYQVTVHENGPMKFISQFEIPIIPNTSCNGGSETCTISLAKPWTSNSAYGFGYNMSGQDIPADFTDNTYYRPFPDILSSENPAIIMSSNNVGRNRQSTVTFKLNVSATQAAGTYQTVINFIATPSY